MRPAAFDKSVVVTRLSITAPRIELLGEDGSFLANASASFYQGEDGKYLVTNWHNLSGINPNTGTHLSGRSSLPSRIRVIGRRMANSTWNVPHEFEIPLRDPKTGLFVWFQHPVHGRKVDVGAVLLPDNVCSSVVCCNEDLEPSPVARCPGDEIFILGYPINISGGLNYPIWKRGSIASEPSEDLDGLPKYLIDSATRKGMSGAPVFFRSHSYLNVEGQLVVGLTAQLFYGIYSGRLPEEGDDAKDPIAAQLGIVWKPQAVAEVVRSKTPPSL